MMSVIGRVVTSLVDGTTYIRIWVLSGLFCFGTAKDWTFLSWLYTVFVVTPESLASRHDDP